MTPNAIIWYERAKAQGHPDATAKIAAAEARIAPVLQQNGQDATQRLVPAFSIR